jgi:hypothetical protein
MVVQGYVKMELVLADNKDIVFKEHTKNGKTYAEVEPDAEYFIKLQDASVQADEMPSKNDDFQYHLFVDDKCVSLFAHRYGNFLKEPKYRGVTSESNGVETDKALKFVKPEQLDNAGTTNRMPLMGKVELKIYSTYSKQCVVPMSSPSSVASFQTDKVAMSGDNISKKKVLRSEVGDTMLTEQSHNLPPGSMATYVYAKELLETITLNYCSAVGLMEVGILKKPNIYVHYNMMRQYEGKASAKRESSSLLPPMKRVRHDENGEGKADLFDLSTLDG